ncbi:hypothetical protein B0J14DRAFT_568953 [Halenospora varia]|nr:hypothetical protein B0J14DRAFT_568953 [Halenospora varia]
MSNSPSPSSTAGSAAEHPDASSAVTSSAQDGASPSTTILATDLQEKASVSTTAGNKRKAVKIASPQHDSQIKKTTTSPNDILQPTKPEAEASLTGTTGKKRRVEATDTQSEPREEIVAEKARRLALHKDITAKIKSYSGEIEIFFDRDPSGGTFSVHRGLLDLHTKYFKQWIKLDNKYVDNFFEEVIHLMSYVDPTYFGQLVSWINTGELLPLEGHVSKSEQLEGMWNLGACVVMPAFQNDCMDELRKYCKETNESGEQWPTLESLLNDHPTAGKYSPLRKFLVHCFTFHNAFANLEYGSEKYKEYENLITKKSNRYVNFDVCVAVALASGKD